MATSGIRPRALSETETHYAQIEKEALALAWALEKFAEYVLGKSIVLETDHKPLQYTINHVPRKTLYTADALSRTPLQETADAGDCTSTDEIGQVVQAVTAALPVNQDRLDSYRKTVFAQSLSSIVLQDGL